ncbi:hypothetical protein M3Y99_01740000 [Aphelenchoides fujianensis]|nr:hypothetical protein M3Y99_01740000 [Aphelenchoides fujianensis]
MEPKVVVEKKKPKLRATNARDGLNRFLLVDAMVGGHTQMPPVFARLTSISAAQLESVRRSARGFKLEHHGDGGALRLPVGPHGVACGVLGRPGRR